MTTAELVIGVNYLDREMDHIVALISIDSGIDGYVSTTPLNKYGEDDFNGGFATSKVDDLTPVTPEIWEKYYPSMYPENFRFQDVNYPDFVCRSRLQKFRWDWRYNN